MKSLNIIDVCRYYDYERYHAVFIYIATDAHAHFGCNYWQGEINE